MSSEDVLQLVTKREQMDLAWMEAIPRLAASQSKIKVRVDYVTPDMKLIIYILQQSFQALFLCKT